MLLDSYRFEAIRYSVLKYRIFQRRRIVCYVSVVYLRRSISISTYIPTVIRVVLTHFAVLNVHHDVYSAVPSTVYE